MKLQDAFAFESGAVGNWANIGYIAPGTKGSDAEHYSTTVFDYENKFGGAQNGTTMVNALGSSFVSATTNLKRLKKEDSQLKLGVFLYLSFLKYYLIAVKLGVRAKHSAVFATFAATDSNVTSAALEVLTDTKTCQ